MLQKNTTAEKNKPELQGLWTINSNNKKLYGFSGSEENMVQKLAQTSLEKKHQSSTEYSRFADFREPLQLLLFVAFLYVKLKKHEW